MSVINGIKANFLYSQKRKLGAGRRKTGPPEGQLHGEFKHKRINCRKCGTDMEFYKEDSQGDWIYSCKNNFCICSKDYDGGVTTKLKKLVKQMNMNSRLYYRTYDGGY